MSNPLQNLALNFLSAAADTALQQGKQYASLPQTPRSNGRPVPETRDLAFAAAAESGNDPDWDDDGNFVLQIDNQGRRWQVTLRDAEMFVTATVASGLRADPALVNHLLTRNADLCLGGWMIKDGQFQLRMTLTKDGCDGVRLHGVAKFAVMEVAAFRAALRV